MAQFPNYAPGQANSQKVEPASKPVSTRDSPTLQQPPIWSAVAERFGERDTALDSRGAPRPLQTRCHVKAPSALSESLCRRTPEPSGILRMFLQSANVFARPAPNSVRSGTAAWGHMLRISHHPQPPSGIPPCGSFRIALCSAPYPFAAPYPSLYPAISDSHPQA